MREELFFATVLSTNKIVDIFHGYQPENNEQFYFVAINQYKGEAVVGGHFDPYQGQFIPPDPTPQSLPLPNLVITQIQSESSIETIGTSEVRCEIGTTVEVLCELRSPENNNVLPISGSFITPIYKMVNDLVVGQRLIKTIMVDGIVRMIITFNENGEWHVNQNGLNSRLEPSQHMAFGGVKIFVYDASNNLTI